jgi:osmotically inducible lipoprotein OsmB
VLSKPLFCCRIGTNQKTNPRQYIMRKTLLLVTLLTLPLAACMEDPASRGLAGAAGGALIADALDENLIAGAAIGALAGAATCGIDIGLPACN